MNDGTAEQGPAPYVSSRTALQTTELLWPAFAHAPLGTCLVAPPPDGRFLAVNDAFCGLLSITPDAALGRPWQDLVHPDDAVAYSDALAALLEDRVRKQKQSVRLPRPDGGEVQVELNASCVRNPDQSVRFLVMQTVEMPGQVTQSRGRAEVMYDMAERVGGTGSWRADLTTGRIEWSKGMLALSDVRPHEFDGNPDEIVRIRVHPDDRPDLLARREAFLSGSDTSPVAFRVVHRDGSVHFLEGASQLERDADGRPTAVVGAVRDVTALEETTQSLGASERRLQGILDVMPAIIAICDARTLKITFMNRRIVDVLGYAPEEIDVLSHDLENLLPEEEPQATMRGRLAQLSALALGEALEWESRIRSAHGARVWFNIRATVFDCDAAGKPISVLLVASDVTAEREAGAAVVRTADRLQATLDAQLDPHVLFTAVRNERGAIVDFAYIDVNGAACRYLGKARDELIGARLAQLYPGTVQNGLLDDLIVTAETGKPLVLDDHCETSLQPPRCFDARAVRVGETVSYTWRDVTERHEAEEGLRRHVAELNALQSLSELLAQSVDLCTALGSANRLLEELLAATRVRVLLLPDLGVDTCEAPFAAPRTADALAEAAVNEILQGEAVSMVSRDEDEQHLLALPLISHGETVGALAILRDAQPAGFTEAEKAVIRTAADLLAAVVWTERLHKLEMQQAAMNERHRLARDLHDNALQTIYSASLLAEALPAVRSREPDDDPNELATLRRLIRAALAEMRILLLELRPETFATTLLETQLEGLGDALAGRSDVALHLAVDRDVRLPNDARMVFFRLAQEALDNIAQHSKAEHVWVTLDRRDGAVRLSVRDDGSGFDHADVAERSDGLSAMRERAQSIGAELEIDSEPGAGTAVNLTWREPAVDSFSS